VDNTRFLADDSSVGNRNWKCFVNTTKKFQELKKETVYLLLSLHSSELFLTSSEFSLYVLSTIQNSFLQLGLRCSFPGGSWNHCSVNCSLDFLHVDFYWINQIFFISDSVKVRNLSLGEGRRGVIICTTSFFLREVLIL
jgi:hypothetical protein